MARAKAMAQRALAIDPDLLPALGNLSLAEYYLGHDEAVIGLSGRWARLEEEARSSGEYDDRITTANRAGDLQLVAGLLGDAREIERQATILEQLGALSTFASAVAGSRAEAAFIRHDHEGAVRLLSPLLSTPDPRALAFAKYTHAGLLLDTSADLDDAAGVRRNAAAFEQAAIQLPGGAERQADALRRNAQIAIAFGRVRDSSEAKRRAAMLPGDCYPCLRAKGFAASASGDRAAAARFFREAIRQAPSIPTAYADLGALMLGAGDANGALEQFRLANAKAPRWPDALKLMGDAFAARRDGANALVHYRRAAELAPRWGALHLAWGSAFLRTGNAEQGRRTVQAALKIGLGDQDRQKAEALSRTASRY
jgi:tetratricopeptide (TPR) repeat protein